MDAFKAEGIVVESILEVICVACSMTDMELVKVKLKRACRTCLKWLNSFIQSSLKIAEKLVSILREVGVYHVQGCIRTNEAAWVSVSREFVNL